MLPKLTPEYVVGMMNDGHTQAGIARLHNVTPQYINKLAREGGYKPLAPQITANLPWKVHQAYANNSIYLGLRLLAHHNMRPGTLRGTSNTKLIAFLRKLEQFDQVVDYDPDYPPVPGLSNTPGFAYVPRKPRDGDYAVRIREGMKITPLGRKMWKMPKTWPKEP